MGLSSALNTSLNGLSQNETAIDVLGNNISNAATTGFKSSSVQFVSQLSRTLSVGSRPTDSNGGTNPVQVGLGATTASIRKDFSQGSLSTSTNPSDFAIQGDGFFVVNGDKGNVYTRDGSFVLNSQNELVNAQGLRVQGYGVDGDFNLVKTQLTDMTIPLGALNVAQQTKEVQLNGTLNPNGDVGTQGALILSDALQDSTAGPGPATAGSLLANVTDAGGVSLFPVGQTVTFDGRKGDRTQQAKTLAVTATTTMGDLLTLMQDTLGIQSGGTIPNDGNTGAQPGVNIVGGRIQITGNRGAGNDLVISQDDLEISTAGGTNQSVGIGFDKQQAGIGESAVTDFVIYDSLGQPLTVKLSATLESNTSSSTTFRYLLESNDDSDEDIALGNGTITFDGNGKLVSGGQQTFSIDRNSTAATSPLQVTADFSHVSGIASDQSRLGLLSQDGTPPGTLVSFVSDEDGVINGVFDNGVTRPLGQIALARFANNQGLIDNGASTFREGVSSGSPSLSSPGSFGAGTVRSGAIELSNTDVGRNLVDLIVASTNYRGNARVISSVQQLVDELLQLGR